MKTKLMKSNFVAIIALGLTTWSCASEQEITSRCPNQVIGISGTTKYFVGDFGIAGCWTTENIKDLMTHTISGANVPLTIGTSSSSKVDMYCSYPNDDAGNLHNYGLQYNWAAATGSNPVYGSNKPQATVYQGVCPSGWHIPSDKEWEQLVLVIASAPRGTYSSSVPIMGLIIDSIAGHKPGIEVAMKMVSASSLNGGESNPYNYIPMDHRGFDAKLWPCMESHYYDGAHKHYKTAFWMNQVDCGGDCQRTETTSFHIGYGGSGKNADYDALNLSDWWGAEYPASVRCKKD